MNIRNTMLFIFVIALTGCAGQPQRHVNLDHNAFMNANHRVGIAMSEVPAPSLALPGADCLLCIAVAASANSGLSGYIKTLDTDDIASLDEDLAERLVRQGVDIVLLNEALVISELPKFKSDAEDTSKQDFSAFQEKYKIDQLLVMDFTAVGAVRPYSSYVPNGDPQAWVVGASYLVDLATNKYHWYLPIELTMSSEGAWKEPPDYPGMTNAYYQVLEAVRDKIISELPMSGVVSAR